MYCSTFVNIFENILTMAAFPKIILKKGKDEAVKRRHPWIFSGAIEGVSGKLTEGDIVEVLDHQRNFLAFGHAQSGSIAVKLFSFTNIPVDADFWFNKVCKAYELREYAGLTDNPITNSYRLIFAEGDQLPGLIVDYFDGCIVVQAHNVGMYLAMEQLLNAFKRLYGKKLKSVYSKSAEVLSKMANYEAIDGFVLGSDKPASFLENGIRYNLDLEGQKTGFFCDQRENRQLFSSYVKNKNILDVFCYTGGFSLNALKAGAGLVVSVDSSKNAIRQLEENLLLNEFDKTRQQSVCEDAKRYLETVSGDFDIIVLDPPAFAKNLGNKFKAMTGYRFINAAAMKKVKRGGLIFTYSCSQAVDRNAFRSAVMAAGVDSGREIQIIHQSGHPADHPTSLFHPEGEYLKGLVVRVL